MKKPDNQRTDLEALRRQLRQEFREIATDIVEEKIDEVLLSGDSGSGTTATAEDPEGDDDGDKKDPNPPKPAPFINVKFRNANKIFTVPTESNAFGDILLASDGTSTVNVVGRIFDDTAGIESYKIRIKRID
jgi:hypothetical protein